MNLIKIYLVAFSSLLFSQGAFAAAATFISCKVSKPLDFSIEVLDPFTGYSKVGLLEDHANYAYTKVEVNGNTNPRFNQATIGNVYVDLLAKNSSDYGISFKSSQSADKFFIRTPQVDGIFVISISNKGESSFGRNALLSIENKNGKKDIALLKCDTSNLSILK
jgi:hypothetical protein